MGLLDLISVNEVAPYAILGFLFVVLIVRLKTRAIARKVDSQCVHVAIAARPYFKNASREPVAADFATYRWAATNWGYPSNMRNFRCVFNLRRTNDPLHCLINYINPQPKDIIQFELKFKPVVESYCCIVANKYARNYKERSQGILARLTPVSQKEQISGYQMCESFNGFAPMLRKLVSEELFANIRVLAVENNVLRMEIDAPAKVDMLTTYTTELFQIARKLMEIKLTDQQERQNHKRNELAQKFEQKQQLIKQQELDEQHVQERIDQLNEELQKDDLTPAQRKEIESRLESYAKRERTKMSKQVAAQMGFGNMSGSRKQQRVVVVK